MFTFGWLAISLLALFRHFATFTLQWIFFNPLNAELNPNCKSQLAEFFCGVFKFCAWYSQNLNISRTKGYKFVKQKAFCGEGNRHCSECLKNAVISLLRNGEDKFLNEIVNIHVLTLLSKASTLCMEDGPLRCLTSWSLYGNLQNSFDQHKVPRHT